MDSVRRKDKIFLPQGREAKIVRLSIVQEIVENPSFEEGKIENVKKDKRTAWGMKK